MSALTTIELHALRTFTATIPEENINGTDSNTNPQILGLFVPPSTVIGRPDITGYFLSAVNNQGKVEWVDNPTATLRLGDLADVDLAGLADGDVIVYDEITQTWVPGSATGIVPGDALAFTGNILDVLYDNVTITINGLNQLELVNTGITLQSTDGITILGGAPVSLGGVATINVDNTVIRTTGNQTIAGTLGIDSLILNDVSGGGGNTITLSPPIPITTSYSIVLPDAQGGVGTILQNDGAGNLSWVSPTGLPGGPNESIQFNDGGAFNGSANFIYDGTDVTLTGGSMFAVAYNTLSDVRMKQNLIVLNPENISTLDLIRQFKALQTYTYEYTFDSKQRHFGFMAQELQQIPIFSSLVTQNNKTNEYQINYTEFIPWICELLKRII